MEDEAACLLDLSNDAGAEHVVQWEVVRVRAGRRRQRLEALVGAERVLLRDLLGGGPQRRCERARLPVALTVHVAFGGSPPCAAGMIEVSVSCAQRSLKPAMKARTRSTSRRWSPDSSAATGRCSRPPLKANEIAIANVPPISGRRPPRKNA